MSESYLRRGEGDFDSGPDSNLERTADSESFLSNVWNNNLDGFFLYSNDPLIDTSKLLEVVCEDFFDGLGMKVRSLVDLCGSMLKKEGPFSEFHFVDGIRFEINSLHHSSIPISQYEVYFGSNRVYWEVADQVIEYSPGEWEKVVDKLYTEKVLPLFE